jgi:hypothetical protein
VVAAVAVAMAVVMSMSHQAVRIQQQLAVAALVQPVAVGLVARHPLSVIAVRPYRLQAAVVVVRLVALVVLAAAAELL